MPLDLSAWLSKPDLSAWLSKPAAAAQLGISERTLDRLCAAGTGPECRNRPRPGKRPEPVYNPSDVETLSAAAAAKPVLFSPMSPIGPQTALVPAADALPDGLSAAVTLLERIAAIAARPAAATFTPWLTIDQAASYSGLSVTFLRRLVRTGQLVSVRDHSVKVRRSDLDNLATVAPLAVGGVL